jgi:hypothetical protein
LYVVKIKNHSLFWEKKFVFFGGLLSVSGGEMRFFVGDDMAHNTEKQLVKFAVMLGDKWFIGSPMKRVCGNAFLFSKQPSFRIAKKWAVCI